MYNHNVCIYLYLYLYIYIVILEPSYNPVYFTGFHPNLQRPIFPFSVGWSYLVGELKDGLYPRYIAWIYGFNLDNTCYMALNIWLYLMNYDGLLDGE